MNAKAGWKEVDHTADAAIQVWAPDMDELFRQAVFGMYGLMGIIPAAVSSEKRELRKSTLDAETLLVAFLTDILSWLEDENLVIGEIEARISSGDAVFRLGGSRQENIRSRIKAVTFHDLAIKTKSDGVQTTIVFDV